MTVTLHIEQLVIEGLPAGSAAGAALQQAIEQELTTLLEQVEATSWHSGHHGTLRSHAVSSPSVPLGQQIARSTVNAIAPQEEHP